MSKNLSALTLIFILVLNLFLAFPGNVLADGGEDGIEKEVNGIHIKLIFAGPVKVGENQFHIQIVDSMGMPVTNEVEVSAMPVEGMDMATDVPAVGVMTGNSDGMDMGAEAPAAGVMKPNEPVADTHGEENITVMLEPTMEAGEYAGKLSFDKSGEWMFNVQFKVNGEMTEVEFPFEVGRALGVNYAVLAGFLGINAVVITTAAVFKKRKSVVAR